MIKNNRPKKWSVVESLVFHQTRIGKNTKQKIKRLSIIEGKTISQITESAINEYMESRSNLIQRYHKEQSKVIL